MRVDLHLHSHYSHDCRSPLQELIDRAKELRLERIAPDLAIVGEEIKTVDGEVIGLFISSPVQPFLA